MDAGRVHRQLQGMHPLNLLRQKPDLRDLRQLETDDALLIPKSRAALSRYGHQLVIGNDLRRRKYEVVFVERESTGKGRGDERVTGAVTPPLGDAIDKYRETWLRLDQLKSGATEREGEVEIEELIVRELVGRHQEWINAGNG